MTNSAVQTKVDRPTKPAKRPHRRALDPEARYELTYADVVAVEKLSSHFTRVTFHSEAFGDFPFKDADQWVKLFFPAADGTINVPSDRETWYQDWLQMSDETRPPMRTYTLRSVDPVNRQVVIDMVSHGDTGPGSRFASNAKIGDRLGIFGSASAYKEFDTDTARIVVGDVTALPAVAAIFEQRPELPTQAFVSVPQSDDQLDFAVPAPSSVQYVLAEGSEGTPELLDTVTAAALRPEITKAIAARTCLVFLAGEASLVKHLRRHFVALGVAKSDIIFIGYWRFGVREDERTAEEAED